MRGGAAGRGVALEALGVGEELAGRLGAAVRCRDGVALAVVALGLRRFEHEADVREVRVVGIVVVGAVDRDVLDHQAALLRDDDARRILPSVKSSLKLTYCFSIDTTYILPLWLNKQFPAIVLNLAEFVRMSFEEPDFC